MGADNPMKWAREKRGKLDDMGAEWREWTAKARDVSLPGVPLAALAGFCANGNPYNTTGWRVGDEAERTRAIEKGRRPFKRGVRGDYGGADRTGDLHEVGWWGTEAGKTPTPVATDPSCPWVTLANDDEVVKVLDREAVKGGAWYGAIADQCAIGCANLRRHWRAMRRRLDPRLQWAEDDKRATVERYAFAMMTWSAGGRGAQHVNDYADRLATLPEGQRWAEFCRLAAAEDDSGNRHRQDEWSALRTAQKIEAAVVFAPMIPAEPWALAWLRADGFVDDAERERVYARLVDVSR
jgi:hypothetical protein